MFNVGLFISIFIIIHLCSNNYSHMFLLGGLVMYIQVSSYLVLESLGIVDMFKKIAWFLLVFLAGCGWFSPWFSREIIQRNNMMGILTLES